MLGLKTLQRWFTPKSSAEAAGLSVAEVVELIQESTYGIQPVLVTGAAGSGKSVLVASMHDHWEGCVVHLRQAERPLLGFDAAPLIGGWLPRTATCSHEADLEDILTARPLGLFQLDMPAQTETLTDIGDLLSQVLMSGTAHWEAYRKNEQLPTLTLVLEDCARWMPESLLSRLVERSRQWSLRIVVVDGVVESSSVWNNAAHVIALKTAHSLTRQRVATWLRVPEDRVMSLAPGRALYLNSQRTANNQPALALNVTMPG
jgi:hypothetical protein